MRPWDAIKAATNTAAAAAGDRRRKSVNGDSPLDALFNMASNFEALKAKSGNKLGAKMCSIAITQLSPHPTVSVHLSLHHNIHTFCSVRVAAWFQH